MKKSIKTTLTTSAIALVLLGGLTGCSQADKVSYNVSKDADNFKVIRRVTVINTRTDKVEMTVQGRISVDISKHQLDIIAKIGDNKYKKDIVNLTGNNMYTINQIETSDVNSYKYEVTFLPKAIVPITVKGE